VDRLERFDHWNTRIPFTSKWIPYVDPKVTNPDQNGKGAEEAKPGPTENREERA
jgi:hypothetical protein